MNSFEWIDAHSIEEAVHLLGANSAGASTVAKAGGMDLLDLMKEGLVQPKRVVNLKTIAGLNDIHVDAQGAVRIGALTTLARIAHEPAILAHFGALAAAANHAATPQVRNVATIAGNLLQRPRCWYFRNAHFARADVIAAVREGENQYHGIFGTDRTPLVHASTPATALLAYDATIHVLSSRGQRSIAIRDFFLPPDPTRDSDVALDAGEVITHITLPPLPVGSVSTYHKQTERDSYDWPICDVAVVLSLGDNRVVRHAAIALGWVAPTPIRAREAEQLLVGRMIDISRAREAATSIAQHAKPLSKNAYKIDVLKVVVERTLLNAAQ
ncbi:MAG TPA: FAD binding domain-containing protein [Steroidobacteraceae bacterium]|nr:FAD binding domain-containing protein [Steroidobacteraceae bacterium]